MAQQILTMTAKMRKCIELEIQEPQLTKTELAQRLGVHQNSITNWTHSPCYQEELDRRLKEETRLYTKKALKQMMSMSEQGSFQATKYLLDYNGYNAEQKVEVTTDGNFVINIGYDQ